ncbi:MAG: hypothetical protein ABI794_02875 [Betaproteobacteria bacterium]
MRHTLFAATVVAAACTCAGPATAQTAELDQIRKDIQELRSSYEARIRVLEDKLKAAESSVVKAQEASARAEASAAKAETTAAQFNAAVSQAEVPPTSQTAFNPALSLILNGTWGRYGNDPTTRMTGFAPSGGDVSPARGASLGESELFLTSSIDPYFRGSLLAAITPENTVEVEEAYAETLALGQGFTVKAGRFFSGLGYLNAVHAHAWDFVDPALVQRAFLGPNYGDDGVQLRWVAPLPVLLQFGAEIGRGREFPGVGDVNRNQNGAASRAFFVKLGGDIGTSGSYQIGASHLRQRTAQGGVAFVDYDDQSGVTNLFSGRQRISGLDMVYKWAPDGNPQYRNFKFAAEWYQRKYDGDLVFDTAGLAATDALAARQSGWYAQAVYQFVPYWRVGGRYDRLRHGTVALNSNTANLVAPEFDPQRYSLMLDWNPSEFSRVRLQYNRDLTRQDIATGATIADNQLFLQYVFSLGAHGAHQF